MSARGTGNENIWQGFVETACRCGDRDAFVRGDQRTSFAQLRRRAQDYGAWLQHYGVVPGDRILVGLEPSEEMASAILGVWATGGIPILMDAVERAPQLKHAIDIADPVLLIHPDSIPFPALNSPPDVISTAAVEENASFYDCEVSCDGSSSASILFTSGSTGKPKGVTQSHRSLVWGCRTVAGCLGLDEFDRILCPIPWSFDYGYGQLLSTLLLGITQILPTSSDPVKICEAIEFHRPTVLPGIPSLFTYLLRGPAPFQNFDLSSLRIVTNTGGTIPAPVLHEMFEVFSHCKIFLNYGLTESYRTTCLPPSFVRERSTSIGKPIPGVDVAIVTEQGSLARPGEVGEIVHRGEYLFKKYWNDPEATARALRPDPLGDAQDSITLRVLFTGDLGSIDEHGFVYFHGRRDRQIKSMGVRVNPMEVEELLLASGLLTEVAVFGRPNDLMGQEVWAAVVPVEDDPKLTQRLGAYAHHNMSKYMKPRRYLVKETLPKTRTGKTDYIALEEEAGRSPTASLLR